ncbi:MAG: trypsin-like peptidase domain-containing protein [Chloroflexi bacterium]|nr:trypsin-like peptidase domain-containing protein [Chloroflexota bacterium]
MSAESSGASALAAFSDALADAVAQAGQSIVRVDGRHRQSASGIVWSASGLIVTADHVVERDDDLGVGLPDGRTVRARLVGRDPSSDLALLQADAADLTPLARSDTARVGSLALLVARPGPDIMASLGTVSAVSGPIRTRRGGRLEGLIATDAGFYPGFSGAPLIVGSGAAVGLATSHFRGGRGSGVVIPNATLERSVATLSAHGRVRSGYVGIGSQPVQLPTGLRERAGLAEQETGLLVVTVESGGPADRAGLVIGDIVVAFAGEAVHDPGELRDLLGPERVGQQVAMRILRGGEPRDLSITVAERNS